MTDNLFIKKHQQRMSSRCDACKGVLLWSNGRLICPSTKCKLYGKQQIIKRPPP